MADDLAERLLDPASLYVALVLVIGTLALIRVLVWLNFSEGLRKRHLEAKNRLDAVATESPVDDPTELAMSRGIESIEQHATVTRRTLVPLIIAVMVLLAAIPLLSKVPATFVSLVVGALTVVGGIAVRPVFENMIAGLVVAFSRQVNIGDTVLIDEHYGTVEDITLTHTTIKLWDWRRYVLPNSRMLQSSVVNLTVVDRFQWAYVEFWVSPSADLEEVAEVARSLPSRSEYYAAHEAPQFWVMEMAKDGIRCWLAAWADSPANAWELRNDMRTALATELRKRGVLTQLSHHAWHPTEGSPR